MNDYYPYNGEDVVEFGIRPVGFVGRASGIDFNFVYATTRQEEYPDTSLGSDLEGFECNTKRWPPDADTFCNGETCTMCYRTLGLVNKDYMLLRSSSSSILSGGYSFADTKEVDPFYEGENNYPGFL